MKALAAILVEQRKPLALEEIEIPALRYGQVLVRVLCSGICGSQLGEIDGVKGWKGGWICPRISPPGKFVVCTLM